MIPPPPSAPLAGLVLAAGESRRMGSPKPLLRLHGETFLDISVSRLAALCSPVIAVLGPASASILASVARPSAFSPVLNPNPSLGMMSSLHCGLRAVPPSAPGVLLTLVDCPAILPSTFSSVARAFFDLHLDVAVPVFDNRRGHPICLSPAVLAALLDSPVSTPPRDIIARFRTPASLVPVTDPGILADADFPGDLPAIEALAR